MNDAILTVDKAAELAGVEPAVILNWIDTRGLRATPIGRVGRRGPRRYLVMASWLYANIEAHSAVAGKAPAEAGKPATGRRVARKASGADPLGPRPTAKARGAR